MRSLANRAIALLAAAFAIGAAIVRAQPPPPAAEQQQVLTTIAEFARDYIGRLPDFTCPPLTQHSTKKNGGDWRPQIKVTQELSYYSKEEHYQIVELNDEPKTKIPYAVLSEGFISTEGNFGSILAQLFDPASRAAFQWKNWET